jgi:hypothetical protein
MHRFFKVNLCIFAVYLMHMFYGKTYALVDFRISELSVHNCVIPRDNVLAEKHDLILECFDNTSSVD